MAEAILIGIGIAYLTLNCWIALKWQQMEIESDHSCTDDPIQFSILIPVRNEAENIVSLIESIQAQSYPKDAYELIVIDDHSTDHTIELVKHCENIKVVHLIGQPEKNNKKRAIAQGIQRASFEYIMTTDGDCVWTKGILQALSQSIRRNKTDLICGPVAIDQNSPGLPWLKDFEMMDTAGMMLVTAAGIHSNQFFLGNGAFLCYKKSDFLKLDPYKLNMQWASGDDVFLVQKMYNNGRKIRYLKNPTALVYTSANDNFHSFFHQRLRWSKKNKQFSNSRLLLFMIIPFVTSLALFPGAFLLYLSKDLFYIFLMVGMMKILGDAIIYWSAKSFFNLEFSGTKIVLLSILHILYISIFGILGLLPMKYRWKS